MILYGRQIDQRIPKDFEAVEDIKCGDIPCQTTSHVSRLQTVFLTLRPDVHGFRIIFFLVIVSAHCTLPLRSLPAWLPAKVNHGSPHQHQLGYVVQNGPEYKL